MASAPRTGNPTGRALQILIATALAVALSACSAIPQVEYACPGDKDAATPKAVADRTAACTDRLSTSIRDLRQTRDSYANWARAGTFFGALAAGTGAMYKAHRDLIVGAALFGGTSYQLGNLYATTAYDSIFRAGLEASECVNSVSTRMKGAVDTVTNRSLEVVRLQASLAARIQSPNVSSNMKDEARSAVARASTLLSLANSTIASTHQLSPPILTAAATIADSVNDQLRKNAPQPEAFQRATDAVLSDAKKLVPAPVTVPPSGKGAAPAPSGAPGKSTPLPDDDAVRNEIDVLNQVSAQVSNGLSLFAGFDASACPQKAIAAAGDALSVKPAKIALKVGDTVNVVARGGQASYRGQWQGVKPAATELEVTQSGSVFVFERKSVISTPRAYVYEVIDQLGKVVEVEIEK